MRIPFGSGLIEPSYARFKASFYDIGEKTCWEGVEPASIPVPVMLRGEDFGHTVLMFGISGVVLGAAVGALLAIAFGVPLPMMCVIVCATLGVAACIALRVGARSWYLFPCERETVARNSRDKISAEKARREEERMRKVNDLYRKATSRRRDENGAS